MALSNRRRVFIEEYLNCWIGSEAARRAGYANTTVAGTRLLANDSIKKEIAARVADKAMTANEVLQRLGAQARGDIGVFFKVVEEWTFYPLATQEIIGAKEVTDDTDPDNPRQRISYWVRHIVVDMDRITDPQYSVLLHKFTDSPKNGIGFEVYDSHAALVDIGKALGVFKEYSDLTVHLPGWERVLEMVYDEPADPDPGA